MLLATVVLYALAMDGELTRGDGVVLLSALVAFLVFVSQSVESETPQALGEYEDFVKASGGGSGSVSGADWRLILVGSACLGLGGICIVEGATEVAEALGLPQDIIGLTVVAIGTSLPELATSLVAAARGEADIAVGNVIGSNIFNIAGILGTASLLEPLQIPPRVLSQQLPAVLFVTVLLLPLLRSGWRIRRWEGALLLAAYIGAGVFLL